MENILNVFGNYIKYVVTLPTGKSVPVPAERGAFKVMLEAQRAARTVLLAQKETPTNRKDKLRNDIIVMLKQNSMV